MVLVYVVGCNMESIIGRKIKSCIKSRTMYRKSCLKKVWKMYELEELRMRIVMKVDIVLF